MPELKWELSVSIKRYCPDLFHQFDFSLKPGLEECLFFQKIKLKVQPGKSKKKEVTIGIVTSYNINALQDLVSMSYPAKHLQLHLCIYLTSNFSTKFYNVHLYPYLRYHTL